MSSKDIDDNNMAKEPRDKKAELGLLHL